MLWRSGEGRGKVPGELETQALMGEWPQVGAQGWGQASLREGELGLAGDTCEGERGDGGHDHGGLELSQGIWVKSQGDGELEAFCAGRDGLPEVVQENHGWEGTAPFPCCRAHARASAVAM